MNGSLLRRLLPTKFSVAPNNCDKGENSYRTIALVKKPRKILSTSLLQTTALLFQGSVPFTLQGSLALKGIPQTQPNPNGVEISLRPPHSMIPHGTHSNKGDPSTCSSKGAFPNTYGSPYTA